MELFERKKGTKPLSERVRPEKIEELIGHKHLTSKNGILRQIIEKDLRLPLVLWGPPGIGKTTVGYVIAKEKKVSFLEFTAAIHTPKEILKEVKKITSIGESPVVVINEIHRFNRLQQEQFLPSLEEGNCYFIFTTTEDPSFSIKGSILSRSRVVKMSLLKEEDLINILKKAFERDQFLKGYRKNIDSETLKEIARIAGGDGRMALNLLESLISGIDGESVDKDSVKKFFSGAKKGYDRRGEDRYTLISAFIKSMRGSDPDASIYYLARMIEGGEDPLYIARRMIIFAAEDVGLADPNALSVAVSAYLAFEKVGLPEGWIPLAEATIYLATALKSNSSYLAYLKAKEDVNNFPDASVPLKLKNPVTNLHEKMGYGKNYVYPHSLTEGWSPEHYLPDKLKGKTYYIPRAKGYEEKIKQIVERLRKIRDNKKSSSS